MIIAKGNRAVAEIKAGQQFTVRVTFSNEPPCDCNCCEYRQYVRGYVSVNEKRIGHPLPDGPLVEDEFREDGLEIGPQWPRVGHRAQQLQLGAYGDDGSTYEYTDFPNVGGLWPGDAYEINLEYEGRIIDVCNQKIVIRRRWKVQRTGKII